MNPPVRRLFFGIWPDDRSRQQLAAWQRSVAWPARARCTAEQDLHLTLHFIGDVPAEALPALLERADLPAFSSLELDLDEVLVWRGGLVVLRARAVPPELRALHEALAAVLAHLGLPVEARPYAPHVTIARSAGHERPAVEPIRWRSHGYRLAARAGAHYATVKSFGRA